MMRSLLVLLACGGLSSPAIASVIHYSDAAQFQAASITPLSQTALTSPELIVFATNAITVDGLTMAVSACSTHGVPACWTQDAAGLQSNAIAPHTYTWGADQSLASLAFTFGSFGGNAQLITVTETDGGVNQFQFVMNSTNLFLALTSTIGLRQVVIADDPSDAAASNWSLAQVAHSAIGPVVTPTPEPTSLALLLVGSAVMTGVRRRHARRARISR